jgi:hypothetical protein
MELMNQIVRAAGIGAVILVGLSAPPALAGYIVDLTQKGSNVVATGSGALNLIGLTHAGPGGGEAFMNPGFGVIGTGPVSFEPSDVYTGFTGPFSFGSGSETAASSGSGDAVFMEGTGGELFLPKGYVSGSALSDHSTYDSQTFSSLGVTPGTYEWRWGRGANQNFTLVVGTVPEPSTWAMLLIGFAGLGLVAWRSQRRRASLPANEEIGLCGQSCETAQFR